MTFLCVVNLALVPDGLQTRASGGARDDLEHLARGARARQTGAHELYVSATPSGSAVSFYQRAGFDVTDEPIEELLALELEDMHVRRPLLARST